MKKIVAIATLTIGLISCGSYNNSNTYGADSTDVELPVTDSGSKYRVLQPSSETGTGATGTTGTGTVADSGNAAHPGSDTTYHTQH